MLTIVTWLWGDKYGPDDVRKLQGGIARNLSEPYRFVCSTDRDDLGEICETTPILDPELTKVKGCFSRLRMFDPEWQRIAAPDSDRIVCCDLDVVITGLLDPVFDRDEPFVIVHGANAANPCPFNGSLMMLRPGAHPEVWSDFSLDEAKRIQFYEFPDDQGWIWHKLPDAAGWKAGSDGVFAFQKPGWPKGTELPADARLVVFPGWRSPAKFSHLPWIREHWR